MNANVEFVQPKEQYLTIKVSRIRDNTDPRLSKLIEIYQASIEPSEQRSPAMLREMVGDPRYGFHVLEDEDKVIGFAIVFTPADREFWLLEYAAIEATRRVEGIGTQLFMSVASTMSKENPGACGVLEVDQVVGHVDTVQAQRRLRFYARCGCKLLEGLNYILPLKNDHTPPAMHILLWGVPYAYFCKDTLTRWLRTIYSEAYSQPSSDSRIAQMVLHLPSKIRLRTDFYL